MMRLFVGVELSQQVRQAAEDVKRTLERQFGETLRARWVPTDNMHLTVRFIGYVSDERGQPLVDALRPPMHVEPFDIALDGGGVFPPHGPPRVLWIGLKEGFASLQAIHHELNARLRPLGFQPEDRPFSAHLTLARVKDAPRKSAALVRSAVRSIDVAEARCHIGHATVFESRLSPRGSTYTALIEIPLSSAKSG